MRPIDSRYLVRELCIVQHAKEIQLWQQMVARDDKWFQGIKIHMGQLMVVNDRCINQEKGKLTLSFLIV